MRFLGRYGKAFRGLLRVCEEISVNNQIFYDNELAEGLF